MPKMQPGISQKVTTDRSQYPPARAVEIWGYLFNDSNVVFSYGIGTRFEFEIRVRDARSRKVVWTWSKGKPGPRTEMIRLQPGQWREHRELWDRRDDSGKRVPAGVYEVELVHVPLREAVTTQIYLMDQEVPSKPPLPEPPSRPRPPRPGGSPLQATLQPDRNRARAGETVRLTYTVTNTSAQTQTLMFASGRQVDMELRRRPEPNARYAAGALTLWQLSRGRSYIMAFTQLALAAGDKKVFTEACVLPAELPSGVYDLVAYLPTARDGNAAEAIATLTVL